MNRARLIPAIVLACGLAGLMAAPASASALVGSLTLKLSDPNTGQVISQATLTCFPTGGTHPDAQAACNDLARANGNINNIPPELGVACPNFVLPVTATATGIWNGFLINYGHTFVNDCWARVDTGGHVFNI